MGFLKAGQPGPLTGKKVRVERCLAMHSQLTREERLTQCCCSILGKVVTLGMIANIVSGPDGSYEADWQGQVKYIRPCDCTVLSDSEAAA